MTTSAPAAAAKIAARAGDLSVGKPADVTILELKEGRYCPDRCGWCLTGGSPGICAGRHFEARHCPSAQPGPALLGIRAAPRRLSCPARVAKPRAPVG